MRRSNQYNSNSTRHGLMAPALAFALLVVMASVALVLDRLWLDTAMVELITVADSASLAAGRELASDDLIRQESDPQDSLSRARSAAAKIASENYVAGQTLELDTSERGDIRFGKIVKQEKTGLVKFIESDHFPTSVLVTAEKTRSRGNPVALFFQELTGQVAGDVATRSEATIDNHVIGVRPIDETPIPGLPIAILKSGTENSWEQQIEQHIGQDQFSYDTETGEVQSGSDGIPEIILQNRPQQSNQQNTPEPNFRLIDFNNDLRSDLLSQQIHNGWTTEDLEDLGGEIHWGKGEFYLSATETVVREVRSSLEDMIGQGRICLLYDQCESFESTHLQRIRCVGLVAGRVMHVDSNQDGSCQIIFQPCVITTRTAILTTETNRHDSENDITNPYIYKLHLTH